MLALVAATLVLTACNDYGTKVQITPTSEVYYKGEGVSEADAKKLGGFLKEQGFFDSSKATTVQLLKEGESYVVKLVIDQEVVSKDKAFYNRFFWYMQQPLTEQVFGGKPAKIVFADDELKDLQPMNSIAKVATKANNRVLYNPNGVTQTDAAKLEEFLIQSGFFDGSRDSDILLDKENDTYNIRFLVDEAAYNQNKDEVNAYFKVFKYVIGQDLFTGTKTNAFLTSLTLKDIETVADLTAEEKQAVDAANAGTASNAIPTSAN